MAILTDKNKVFMNFLSKAQTKIVLTNHFKSVEHIESFRAEGMKKAQDGVDKKYIKHIAPLC